MNIDWTPNQTEGFRWAMRQENTRRAAQDPPLAPLDIQGFCALRLGHVGDDYYNQKYSDDKVTVSEAFKTATPAVKTQVRTLLGLTAPEA